MYQDGIGPGCAISLGPLQGLIHAPARDQCLHPCNNAKIRVLPAVFTGPDLAAKFINIGQGLFLAVNEAVGLGEFLVFNADAGYAALFELSDQAPHVVEVAVTGITVQQDRDIRGVGHEFQHVDDLGPACFITVPDTELGRHGQAAGPDPLEPCLLHEFGRDAVMGFQDELQFGRAEQGA